MTLAGIAAEVVSALKGATDEAISRTVAGGTSPMAVTTWPWMLVEYALAEPMLEASGGRGPPPGVAGSMNTEIAAMPSEKIKCCAGIGEPGMSCSRLATRRKPGGTRTGRQP